MKKKRQYCSEEQVRNVRQLFAEFKECDLGINFVSWISIDKNGESDFISSSLQWEKIYREENIIEKDMLNYIPEAAPVRKWVCWNNCPKTYDPYGLIVRRIEVCQTIKSASLIICNSDRTNYFNFAFGQDIDIENFLWKNTFLIENYAQGIMNNLYQC
jgi:hypothetical protein